MKTVNNKNKINNKGNMKRANKFTMKTTNAATIHPTKIPIDVV